jgi:hypothetical protein
MFTERRVAPDKSTCSINLRRVGSEAFETDAARRNNRKAQVCLIGLDKFAVIFNPDPIRKIASELIIHKFAVEARCGAPKRVVVGNPVNEYAACTVVK